MNLDILTFYLDAVKKAQKNDKLNNGFLDRLKVLFVGGEIEEDVYRLLVDIIHKTIDKTIEKTIEGTSGKETKNKIKVGNKKRPVTQEEAQAYIKKFDVYVLDTDGCRSWYGKASVLDVLQRKDLFIKKTIDGGDPYNGPSYDYKLIVFEPETNNVGSCEGIQKGGC